MVRKVANDTVEQAQKEIDALLRKLKAGTIDRRKLESGLKKVRKRWDTIAIMHWKATPKK